MKTNHEDRRLETHPMYTPSDLAYFRSKGYTDDEVLEIWDRDLADGKDPVHHKPVPDVVSRIFGN